VEFSSASILAARFLDPPRFTWACVGDAAFYRARAVLRDGTVLWEGTLEEEALDFAPFWSQVPVGEVAWAVTAWGSEGQVFDESGARRFHRAEEWQPAGEAGDPELWERAARRWARFFLTYRGPELGLFHRDRPPPGCVAVPIDPGAPPYRHHSAVVAGRFLRVGADPHRDHAPLAAALLTLADRLGGAEAPRLRARAEEIREWLGDKPDFPREDAPVPPDVEAWRSRRADGVEDLSLERALAAVRGLLAAGETGAARALHRGVEDLFVTYGEDGSIAEAPYVPAARAWAGEAWVRDEATAAWLETLGALFEATRRKLGFVGEGEVGRAPTFRRPTRQLSLL